MTTRPVLQAFHAAATEMLARVRKNAFAPLAAASVAAAALTGCVITPAYPTVDVDNYPAARVTVQEPGFYVFPRTGYCNDSGVCVALPTQYLDPQLNLFIIPQDRWIWGRRPDHFWHRGDFREWREHEWRERGWQYRDRNWNNHHWNDRNWDNRDHHPGLFPPPPRDRAHDLPPPPHRNDNRPLPPPPAQAHPQPPRQHIPEAGHAFPGQGRGFRGFER